MSERPAKKSRLALLLPALVDILVPVAVYYVLHMLHVNDFAALTAGGAASGLFALIDVFRKRKFKSVSLLVFAMFALTIVLMFVTKSPRLLLIKPAIYTLAAGIYILLTTFKKPFLLEISEPFATDGDSARAPLWQNAWKTNEGFRRKIAGANVFCGVATVCEAFARAVIVLKWPVAKSALLSQLPAIALMMVFAIVGRFLLKPASERAMARAERDAAQELAS